MVDPNWELTTFCNHDQKVFLVTIGVFTVVILALWRTFLLTPFKLITVFLHEASHAIAAWLTCGQVEGIQVHANEGGVTQTRGGAYWVILPAGCKLTSPPACLEKWFQTKISWSQTHKLNFLSNDHNHSLLFCTDLGSSFWGMLLVVASTDLLTSKIAAGCFIAALVIVLSLAKNWTLRGLCVGFMIFIGVVWLLQEKTTVKILRYVILFIGVMNSLFSVYDIYDDTISRRVNSSDAEKFAEVCPCPCNGVAWGVIWGMISFVFLCGAMYLGLVILS